MIRQIATVATGTLSSRLLGFMRDALIATLLGTEAAADAFLFAFQLVNVARRVLSEGAFNAAFVPAYLRLRQQQGEGAATAFAGRVLGTVSAVTVIAAILLGVIMPIIVGVLAPGFSGRGSLQMAVDAIRLMLPYLAFVGPVAVLMALLNANGQVAWSAFSPLLFNAGLIAMTAALLIGPAQAADRAAMLLAVTVGAAGLLQACVVMLPGARAARPFRISTDGDVIRLLRHALPVTLAQSGPQLLVLAAAIAASLSPGAVAAIYFANRLIELPLGIVGVGAGAVIMTRLSEAQREGGRQSIAIQSRALEFGIGLALPAAIGLAVLARPVVDLLFRHGAFGADDAARTASALVLLAAALPAHAVTKLLAPRFFARERTQWPLLSTLCGLLVTTIGAVMLQRQVGESGTALAIAAGAVMSALTLAMGLALAGDLAIDQDARRRLPLICLAAGVMGGALLAAKALMGGADASFMRQATLLGLLIALGLLVYVVLLRLFGVVDFGDIKRAFRAGQP